MKKNSIAVTATSPELRQKAEHFALLSHLPFIADASDLTAHRDYDFLVSFTPHFIGLQPLHPKSSLFKIDFLSGKMLFRSQQLAGVGSELLAKALGLKPKDKARIIDATAGLGRDSFILASLGFHIVMLERSPILFLLLKDALERALTDRKIAPIINRLQLIQADASQWLESVQPKPDIIYLDPMFPERKKSASVKKEMVILQNLLGKEDDSDKLLIHALSCATRRVVVKRPRLAPNLANIEPSFSLKGKSSRFDIYLSKQKI